VHCKPEIFSQFGLPASVYCKHQIRLRQGHLEIQGSHELQILYVAGSSQALSDRR
jgi:hypothetical protein